MTSERDEAPVSMGVVFRAQLRRDLALAWRDPGDWAQAVAFYVLVISLFPVAISPDARVLSDLAPGVLWIAALLATLLGLEGLFRRDREEGSLEQFVLRSEPLYVAVLARLTAHWLVTGAPLTLLAPVLGVLLSLPDAMRLPVFVGLALGTPILTLLGGVGAALVVGLRSGGTLLALLVVPLYVPVLILGVGAAELADTEAARAPLLWLGAGLALAVTAVPFAVGGALRIGVENG